MITTQDNIFPHWRSDYSVKLNHKVLRYVFFMPRTIKWLNIIFHLHQGLVLLLVQLGYHTRCRPHRAAVMIFEGQFWHILRSEEGRSDKFWWHLVLEISWEMGIAPKSAVTQQAYIWSRLSFLSCVQLTENIFLWWRSIWQNKCSSKMWRWHKLIQHTESTVAFCPKWCIYIYPWIMLTGWQLTKLIWQLKYIYISEEKHSH